MKIAEASTDEELGIFITKLRNERPSQRNGRKIRAGTVHRSYVSPKAVLPKMFYKDEEDWVCDIEYAVNLAREISVSCTEGSGLLKSQNRNREVLERVCAELRGMLKGMCRKRNEKFVSGYTF
ncbi:hypothetical protein TWF730_007662 [Orbilia blumenaviensis]|uniref:Uncharacterized protein n=1 Tax=Orbilia blumenaviensis TaxID=1796055 RepID=A0AAV9VB19_9PEZI